LPRHELNNLKIGVHGGLDYSEIQALGLAGDRILDFSVCCNPFPPASRVRQSLRRLKINAYPDSQSSELRSKISQKLGLSPDRILVGSGTTELIRMIALAYFNKGDCILIPGPVYGEYEAAARLAGAEVVVCRWPGWESGSVQITGLLDLVREQRPRAVFLCNPNNPTGHYLGWAEIETLMACLQDGLLVLDEAYLNFVERPWSSLPLIDNGSLIIIRSMTKDYGLAGLRLGYALAREDIIRVLRQVCLPWNVNVAAQQAGLAVLESDEYLRRSLRKIWQSKQFLVAELARIGWSPLPSQTHFFLVKVPNARSLRQALLRQGFLVRDCKSFGCPDYIRLSPRSLKDCRQLIDVLTRMKQKGELDEGS